VENIPTSSAASDVCPMRTADVGVPPTLVRSAPESFVVVVPGFRDPPLVRPTLRHIFGAGDAIVHPDLDEEAMVLVVVADGHAMFNELVPADRCLAGRWGRDRRRRRMKWKQIVVEKRVDARGLQ